ncbi:MAG TPA: hypothetical protein VHH36_04510 [Candidatus Thermoplasmatota archaeon]|nr:hypothetical protein [Candidatus Thermoplasmatota archaeon]
MRIEPDMVMGKPVVDPAGGNLGEIVDVGLYSHDRVKFLVVEDKSARVPIRRLMVDEIDDVSATTVRVRVRAG